MFSDDNSPDHLVTVTLTPNDPVGIGVGKVCFTKISCCFYFESDISGVQNEAAIIYTPDSPGHKKRVKALEQHLRHSGINVEAIGDCDDMRMRGNWIGFGEEITETFSVIIVVISPALTDMCSQNKHIRQPAMLEEDAATAELLYATHRLPLVVIDSLKSRNIWRVGEMPTILQVNFMTAGEKKMEVSQLQMDHPSLFSSSVANVLVDDDNKIKNDDELKKILRC